MSITRRLNDGESSVGEPARSARRRTSTLLLLNGSAGGMHFVSLPGSASGRLWRPGLSAKFFYLDSGCNYEDLRSAVRRCGSRMVGGVLVPRSRVLRCSRNVPERGPCTLLERVSFLLPDAGTNSGRARPTSAETQTTLSRFGAGTGRKRSSSGQMCPKFTSTSLMMRPRKHRPNSTELGRHRFILQQIRPRIDQMWHELKPSLTSTCLVSTGFGHIGLDIDLPWPDFVQIWHNST